MPPSIVGGSGYVRKRHQQITGFVDFKLPICNVKSNRKIGNICSLLMEANLSRGSGGGALWFNRWTFIREKGLKKEERESNRCLWDDES